MIKVSQQQALDRWDTIPQNLRETIASDVNSDFVWKTAEGEHLPEEKIKTVSRLAGYVLLGFIHPGDLGQEIKEALNIDPQIANTITNAINDRIFAPLKTDLEKIYEPPSALVPSGSSSFAPKPLDTAQSKPPIVPALRNFNEGGSRIEPPKPFVTSKPTDTVRPINPFSITGSPIAPKPETKPSGSFTVFPPPPKPPIAMGRIEPSTTTGITPPPLRISTPGVNSNEPPPVIIHEETGTVPGKSQGFKLDIPQPKFRDVKLGNDTKPAVIEFSGQKPATTPPTRVVHYSEMRTPVISGAEPRLQKSAPSPANGSTAPFWSKAPQAGREVKEITMETNKPASTPIPKPQVSAAPATVPVPSRIEPPSPAPPPRPPMPPSPMNRPVPSPLGALPPQEPVHRRTDIPAIKVPAQNQNQIKPPPIQNITGLNKKPEISQMAPIKLEEKSASGEQSRTIPPPNPPKWPLYSALKPSVRPPVETPKTFPPVAPARQSLGDGGSRIEPPAKN